MLDVPDFDPFDPTTCEDTDADGCDDCAIGVDGLGPATDNTPGNDGPDMNNILSVFDFIFANLDEEVTVLPTENYYYFRFYCIH